MAGTVTLSLQQLFDNVTHEFLVGGKLYFFQSGTTTPQNAFTSAGLTTSYANPLTLESDARVPYLWFADGTIRIRVTNSAGVVQFDFDNMQVIGASGGGGGVDTTDPNSILSTGDMKWRPSTGLISGWVRANARTIGSATSGAAERANADCENLFLHLWNNFSDTICPVVTGRGANAAADWAANKQITVIDMRGRAPFGVDDMGNSVASRITSATITDPTTGGSSGGAQRQTLLTANLPPYTPSGSVGITDTHTHFAVHNSTALASGMSNDYLAQNLNVGTDFSYGLGSTTSVPGSGKTSTASPAITAAFTGTAQGGSSSPVTTLPPAMIGNWYMRL